MPLFEHVFCFSPINNFVISQTKESEHKKTNNPENKTELALAFEYNFQLILKAHWSIEGISFFQMSNTGVRETKTKNGFKKSLP